MVASHNKKQTNKKLGLNICIKWRLFRLLESLAELRQYFSRQKNLSKKNWLFPAQTTTNNNEKIWVFVSTIGELNLIKPFLDQLLADLGNPQLVLLTDHTHYREPYHGRYPHAHIAVLNGSSKQIRELAHELPPTWLQITEIPCRLSEAPCRFPFAAIYEAKRKGAWVFIVNGWLYQLRPRCRMDSIEKTLFDQNYIQLIDLHMVQNEYVKNALISAGADPANIHITGNVKFDALANAKIHIENEKSPDWLASIMHSQRPCIVAGCLSDLKEQELVLDAFTQLTKQIPEALLIIVPRHPEFTERMSILENFIQKRNLSYGFKTKMATPMITNTEVLVIDTIGELKGFYSICNLAFVGVDHNILEPLSYDKPVAVAQGWHQGYPSYPVYRLLKGENVIKEISSEQELCDYWLSLLRDQYIYQKTIDFNHDLLVNHKGAIAKSLQLVKTLYSTSS